MDSLFARTPSAQHDAATRVEEKRFWAWQTVESTHDLLQGHDTQLDKHGKRPQMHPHELQVDPGVLLDDASLSLALDSLHKAYGILTSLRDRKRARACLVLIQRVSEELSKYALGLCDEGNDSSLAEEFEDAEKRFNAAIAVYKYVLANFRKRGEYMAQKTMLRDEQMEMDRVIAMSKDVLESLALCGRRRDLRASIEAANDLEEQEM